MVKKKRNWAGLNEEYHEFYLTSRFSDSLPFHVVFISLGCPVCIPILQIRKLRFKETELLIPEK